MMKTDGQKNLGKLSDQQKKFIRELLAFVKKPRKIVSIIQKENGEEQQPENSLHFLKS